MKIYYYYPIHFNYTSGQTIQVLSDYEALAKLGFEVHLFGTYDDANKLEDIKARFPHLHIDRSYLIKTSTLHSAKWARSLSKLKFLSKILLDRGPKILISRNYTKLKELTRFRFAINQASIVWEMHEDPFPHLLEKNKSKKNKFHAEFSTLCHDIDGIIFTSSCQKDVFKKEFGFLPNSLASPNGVEVEKFKSVKPTTSKKKFPIAYVGQFTKWKNVELLFHALSFLDERFYLKIAGGKKDAESKAFIDALTKKYQLEGRVDFHGFIQPEDVPSFLHGSSVLAVPLGDNLHSRFFTSPMKLFEYMATKIPVVAVDFPTIQAVASPNEIFLSSLDPQEFAKCIVEAATSDAASEKVKKMNKKVAEYSYEKKAFAVKDFLTTLANQKINKKGRK